jgi:hypothetical protein
MYTTFETIGSLSRTREEKGTLVACSVLDFACVEPFSALASEHSFIINATCGRKSRDERQTK